MSALSRLAGSATTRGPTAPPARSTLRSRAAAPLLLLALWQGAAMLTAGRFLIAGPAEVAAWLVDHPGLTLRAARVTLMNALAGFVAGNLAAMLLAALAMLWPRSRPAVLALALAVYCLPLVATGPILRVLLGPGNGPQIWLAALAVYYTTLIPLLAGLNAAPAAWLDLVHVAGRGRLAQLVHVRARASLPYLLAGLQIAAPAAVLGAVVGEFTGAERGLGVLTIRFMRALDVPGLWAVASVAAAASLAAYAAIGALAGRLHAPAPPVILAAPAAAARSATRRAGTAALVVLAVPAAWWAAVELLSLNPFFAKHPGDLWQAVTSAPDAASRRATLARAAGETLSFLLPGYLAGLALGAGLAAGLALVPQAARLVTPLALAMRAIPIITTAPLIVLAFGRGAAGTIAIVTVMVFFPTLIACRYGLAQAPGRIMDLMRSHAAGPLARLRHAQLPAMLPALFASARMAVPAAVLAVTVAEWLATGRGLGQLMALSASVSDYTMLWLCVSLVTIASAAGYACVAAAERRVLANFAPEQLAR